MNGKEYEINLRNLHKPDYKNGNGVLREIVKSPGFRTLLSNEALVMYRDALVDLGVHEDDANERAQSLEASLDSSDSSRNNVAQMIDAAYAAKRAAERHKSRIDVDCGLRYVAQETE